MAVALHWFKHKVENQFANAFENDYFIGSMHSKTFCGIFRLERKCHWMYYVFYFVFKSKVPKGISAKSLHFVRYNSAWGLRTDLEYSADGYIASPVLVVLVDLTIRSFKNESITASKCIMWNGTEETLFRSYWPRL